MNLAGMEIGGWLNYYKLAQENDLFKLIKLADKTEISMLREMSAQNTDTIKYLYDSKQFVSMEEWYNTLLSR